MKRAIITALTALLLPLQVMAEPMPLAEYLASVDRAQVTFSGEIAFHDRDRRFSFRDENQNWFQANLDTGRDIREQIESDCLELAFSSSSNRCSISGAGTVEIRGSQIFISIDRVDSLSK